MHDKKHFMLLIDLVKLYQKYGQNTFEELAHILKSESFISSIEQLTEDAPGILRTLRKLNLRKFSGESSSFQIDSKPSGPDRRASISKEIEKIKGMNNHRYTILTETYSKLKSGDLLPSMSNIRSFATRNNLVECVGRDRRSSIPKIMHYLLNLEENTEKLSGLVREMVSASQSSGENTLQRWADLIMRKRDDV